MAARIRPCTISCARCRRCGWAISRCGWRETRWAWPARSPIPSTRSWPRISAWRSSSSASGRRVAREVGTEGKLGGQAQVREVTGVWKDLTESVNSMASNLTAQVRNIADVTIAVANGDLSKKITVDVRGEILQLKEAINTMVDQLRSFASEVTRV